jgi:uncharacterized protein
MRPVKWVRFVAGAPATSRPSRGVSSMAEQRAFNPWVQGSTPWRPTSITRITRITRIISITRHEPGCDDGCVTDIPRTDGDVPQITDNQAASRFEFTAEGRLAELIYHQRANRLVLIHTEVPPELGGHGIGGALVAAALDRAGREGLTVVPLCPFARTWLERHPGAAAKVTIDWDAK